MIKLSQEQAHNIYTILVGCGADSEMRESFVHYVTHYANSHEWRFQGDFGFGGKLYTSSEFRLVNGKPEQWIKVKVKCYPEDMTEERRNLLEKVNKRLDEVMA